MSQILVVTVPFFALVLCGYLAARWRWLPLESIPGLNAFVLFFALPCMLYRFAAMTPIGRLLDAGVSLTYGVCALMVLALALVATRRGALGWNDASFSALVAAFPNSGFMGVPLLVQLLGERAAGPAIVCLVVDMVVTSSVCIALSRLGAAGEQRAWRAAAGGLKGVLRNPLPWAIGIGCMTAATEPQLPRPALRAVEMLADAASPAALFTLGVVLARSRLARTTRPTAGAPATRSAGTRPAAIDVSVRDVGMLAACKLIVHPALVFGVGSAVIALGAPLDRHALTVLVLTAALPSASNVSMLAERFGADSERVARVVLLTTVLAFVSFPLAVGLLR